MSESPIIEVIKGKIDRLIADNRRLRKEYQELSAQRDKLKVEKRELEAEVARLEKRITVLELSESMAGRSGNTKLARARVNRLMREVDKCIALLNR